MRILFVCLGNICRSPLAEGILRFKLAKNNIQYNVDSAGTLHWHAGNPPDDRSIKTAAHFGIDISNLRGRQFSLNDFSDFDLILPMDLQNKTDLLKLARTTEDRSKIQLCLHFAGMGERAEVPDPYYGDLKDFMDLYHLLEMACDNMIRKWSH